ncbi:MAG TPA: DUF305 domain-containing protein [Vicinamibacterales bacterium]|jgi:uncharacterized protein (DUF305 family)|nr:DUF305 domain-containing protein [Vicinamibacterales bacterium]
MIEFEHRARHILLAALLLVGASACRTAQETAGTPPIVQPGAPGQASQVVAPEKARDQSNVQATPADVKFMQGMIHHHAQALDMVALLMTRTGSDDMKKLADRIRISQADEIGMMQRWLRGRGQGVPDPHALHMPGMIMPGMDHEGPMMPGMLTPEEMAHLATLKGPDFDRAFLEGMIKHHGGALTMVQELFATRGAGQESMIFAFASDVDADQRMEIDRMSAMLAKLKEPQQ